MDFDHSECNRINVASALVVYLQRKGERNRRDGSVDEIDGGE